MQKLGEALLLCWEGKNLRSWSYILLSEKLKALNEKKPPSTDSGPLTTELDLSRAKI